MTTWTDWRGHAYTTGDTVLYARTSGRSCEMAEGTVVDLWEVYRGEGWEFARLAEGELPPFHRRWRGFRLGTDELIPEDEWRSVPSTARESRKYDTDERVQTERRARIQPTGRTSRFHAYAYAAQRNGGIVKPVTLTVTESITAIVP